MDHGKLIIVPTPIGNIADISLRAIEVLFSADGIVCEDTRKTGMLLREIRKRYPELAKPAHDEKFVRMLSYYEENELKRIPEIISALQTGMTLALVSDAGTPTISDPGFKLVRECIKENIEVIALPGPSSVTTALSLSGLPTDKYLFLGYPPRKPGHRVDFFEKIKKSQLDISSTLIFFEAPHRMVQFLTELEEAFGKDMYIVVCRELTKKFEQVKRDSVENMSAHFKKVEPKGEFIVLLNMSL